MFSLLIADAFTQKKYYEKILWILNLTYSEFTNFFDNLFNFLACDTFTTFFVLS